MQNTLRASTHVKQYDHIECDLRYFLIVALEKVTDRSKTQKFTRKYFTSERLWKQI